MSSVAFKSLEYGDGEAINAVALVAGFDGKIAHFEQASVDLTAAGHDVVTYEYDNCVFLDGDGELLPNLIADLSEDFLKRTASYDTHGFAGTSLGAGIAWNMQKDTDDATRGLYAAVGTDVAKLVIQSKLFRSVVRTVHKVDTRKAFERRGYTLQDLQEAWSTIQTPPLTPFAVAYGSLDYIVRQREVAPKVAEWQKSNDIRVINKQFLGHTGIIKWFNNNIPEMLHL